MTYSAIPLTGRSAESRHSRPKAQRERHETHRSATPTLPSLPKPTPRLPDAARRQRTPSPNHAAPATSASGGAVARPGLEPSEMLPEIDNIGTVVVCEDDEPTRGAALRRPHRRPVRGAPGGDRRRGAAPVPLRGARPAAARPRAARRLRARRPPRDPRRRRRRGALRPGAARGRPERARRRTATAYAVSAEGADDYLVKPFSYAGAADPAAQPARAAARAEEPGRPAVGLLTSTSPPGRSRVGDGRSSSPNKEFELLRALAGRPRRGLHQGGAAARRLGLPVDGQDPDARLAREPAAAQARSRARPLRDQLLGRRLPAGGGVSGRGGRIAVPSSLAAVVAVELAPGWLANVAPRRLGNRRRCTSCAARCSRSRSRSLRRRRDVDCARPASSRPSAALDELDAAVERPASARAERIDDRPCRARSPRWSAAGAIAGVRVDSCRAMRRRR